MSESFFPVVEAVRYAMTASRPADLEAGVKLAVSEELEAIDPGLTITQTAYFNHSFKPDLLANWSDLGRSHTRPIYLRGAVGELLDNDDIAGLGSLDPMFIGLQQEKRKVSERVKRRSATSPTLLAAELHAVARIAPQSTQPGVASSSSSPPSPLSGLVRANLLRGGRGYFSNRDAARIAAVESEDSFSSMRAFGQTVQELFDPSLARRLSRTAELLSMFFDASGAPVSMPDLAANPLTEAELKAILPYLLAHEEIGESALWASIGAMVTLSQIEDMALELEGLDLTPLIAPAASSLLASKLMLVASPDELSEEQFESRKAAWRIRSLRLSADVGPWAVFIARDGRSLRPSDGGVDARWDDISDDLKVFDLNAVKLHGLSDRLQIAGDEPSRVRENVERVRQTIQDDFHVPSVTVSAPDQEGAVPIDVDFASRSASGRNVPIADLILAGRLLARGKGFNASDIDRLVRRDLSLAAPAGASIGSDEGGPATAAPASGNEETSPIGPE